MSLIHALARLGLAFTWIWQGLIPKLLYPSVDEKAMLGASGLPESVLPIVGAVECAIALGTLCTWRWRPLFLLNALLMAAALLSVVLRSPSYLVAAFNPVTLNVLMIVLSAAGYISSEDLPSASRCLRQPRRTPS